MHVLRWSGCVLFLLFLPQTTPAQPMLVGHWPLQGTLEDQAGQGLQSTGTAIRFENDGPNDRLRKSALFDGVRSVIEIPNSDRFTLRDEPFSIAVWLKSDDDATDVPGDIVSQYDFNSRCGFHLGLYSHSGVTNSQSNRRQLHFGIDKGAIDATFTDHGPLGNAVFVFSLCVHNERMYAATCHAGANEAGHVFRFEGGDRWTDLGSPDQANAISAMTEFDGSLYVASSKYRLAGSSLAESTNSHMGGKVFRLGPGDKWIPCGTVSEATEAISSLIEFRGRLYAGSLYKPAGFFRYEGDENWVACPTPDGKRVEAMTVFNNALYATCYDEGSVFRFDGESWQHVGLIPNATQTYGFAVHRGRLFVSEWPQAHVYRYDGESSWTDAGKLGEELEAMPLLVYNGKMYGGTLPSAEVYRYDGDTNWARIGRTDFTPDVRYRRAWSMAVFEGRLFVGTLPSGRVLSIQAGENVTFDRSLSSHWHHVAAIREPNRLLLYVDGQRVAQSAEFDGDAFDVSNDQPLHIGFGAQDYFRGHMADLRIYRGALSESEVKELAEMRP